MSQFLKKVEERFDVTKPTINSKQAWRARFAELNENYPGIKFSEKIDEAYLNTKKAIFSQNHRSRKSLETF